MCQNLCCGSVHTYNVVLVKCYSSRKDLPMAIKFWAEQSIDYLLPSLKEEHKSVSFFSVPVFVIVKANFLIEIPSYFCSVSFKTWGKKDSRMHPTFTPKKYWNKADVPNKFTHVGLDKFCDANPAHSGAQNLWGAPDFSRAHVFPCKKEKKKLNL